MKNKLLLFLFLISSGAFAQNRMYNLTTQFDSVKVRKLLLTSIATGGIDDSVLVKKPNGGVFKVARSSFAGGGSGTVSSFGKVDGFGVTSFVTNATTTPVHTIAVDTSSIRSVLNSYNKAQVDAKNALKQNIIAVTTMATAPPSIINSVLNIPWNGVLTYLTASGNGTSTISIPHFLTSVTSMSNAIVIPRNLASVGSFYVTTDVNYVNIIYTSGAPATGSSNLAYTIQIRP